MNTRQIETVTTQAAKIKTSRLRTADAMQEIITRIAMKHGLDLSATDLAATDLSANGAHLRLEQGGFMPLVIEKLDSHLVSVAHHYQQTGDAFADSKAVAGSKAVVDPDVVFFTGYGNWIPIEITQRLRGYRRSAELSLDGCDVTPLNPMGQVGLTYFCEAWARNLHAQGWLERSSVAGMKSEEDANRQT